MSCDVFSAAALGLCASLLGFPVAVDGDTIKMNGTALRIYGLDAEELSETNGPRAKDGMIAILKNTSYVKCHLTGETSYNRQIAVCYNDKGQDIAMLMVRDGYALDCARYSGGRYREFEPFNIRNTLTQKPYCKKDRR
jgi:endonuclease YncB( thermonuclease family)